MKTRFSLLRSIKEYTINKFTKTILRTDIVTVNSACKLCNKNVIVTGGGKGLGYAIAKRFCSEGGKVLVCGRNEKALETVSEEIGCRYLKLDLSRPEDFERFIEEAEKILGGLDILVNNAGISLHESSFETVTQSGMESQLKTNFIGPYFLTQEFIKKLRSQRKSGNILFISSETGETVDVRPYGLTKAAVNSLVQGLAHAYKLKGIRINAIAPGITATDMTGVDKNNLYADNYGAGRFYLPEEVAEVATFLVSDAANCISGQIITCNNAETVNARWKK